MKSRYTEIRERTTQLCLPLSPEDSTIQPIADVSPPKWHLAHSTWFFETFLLKPHVSDYKEFNPDFNFLFNSYYEGIGDRVPRERRGFVSRPGLAEVKAYRKYVDEQMVQLFSSNYSAELETLVELGLQHEQQHQELLQTDIKYILSTNPLLPVYDANTNLEKTDKLNLANTWKNVEEGLYEIGYSGNAFFFDNELGRHRVFLHAFSIQQYPVSNAAYIEFINSGGYTNYDLWLAEGWDWVKRNNVRAPLYWQKQEEIWHHFTLRGLVPVESNEPVSHVSYYEADAFARWSDARLPTEFEWESAATSIEYGARWEWTNSAYLPYPYFSKAAGAIGEYNGKFMINQMVLRGGSVASPPGHVRPTYRNFFPPDKQWQYSGIRLAKSN